jgi:hypothetical protein
MDQCRRQRTAKDHLSGAKTRRNKSARERKAVKRRALATVGIRRARGEAPKKEQIRAPLKKAGGQAGEEETDAGRLKREKRRVRRERRRVPEFVVDVVC